MKQVRETSAAKQITAFVVISPKGNHVATIQAAFLDSGTVIVNVWDNSTITHERKAMGGGYDKFTAALSGAKIDGIELFDFSEITAESKQMLADVIGLSYDEANKVATLSGFEIANWHDKQYRQVLPIGGLPRLKAFGYTVIKAI